MMVSDEEKRWIVVGIALNKVAAAVFRDYIKQGMDTHYAKDTFFHGLTAPCLTAPCTLKTLTYHHVNADPNLKRLKFQNINNNMHNHGNHKNLYNYNINSSVDLAKLFLPDYLAEFSAFDESLDVNAILRLLGFNNPAPIFPSPNPSTSIQTSADDVRENVRNKWGHCNVTDWTEVFFSDCFSKLETLVRSLGLTGGLEKNSLDELSDWQTKGCQLCMGHAVDKSLLSLLQVEVSGMIRDFALQRSQLFEVQGTVSALQEQLSSEIARSSERDARLDAVEKELQGEVETRIQEINSILERLVLTEETLSEVLRRVQGVEKGLAATNVRVKVQQLGLTKTNAKVDRLEEGLVKTNNKLKELQSDITEEGFVKTDGKLEELQEGFTKTVVKVEGMQDDLSKTNAKLKVVQDAITKTGARVEGAQDGLVKTNNKVEQLHDGLSKTDDKVERLEREVKSQRMQDVHSEVSPVDSFDAETCQRTLAEHYKRTATVPTSVWSKKSPVDINQIYTRLSWVKEEQNPAGSSQKALSHYTDVFTSKKNGVVPKRILVQGQTGIGKTTFVKKLALDWAEVNDEKTGGKQTRLEDEENISKVNEQTSQCEFLSGGEYEDTSSESDENMSRDQKDALRKFEILLVINLREVSKYQKLQDIISHSHIFPVEETFLTEGLLSYITKNQEKVLLVFDGYDEYRFRNNSEIYEIFKGNKLRHCCVLITTRISTADELREFKDVHAEITGFSEKDREAFMGRILGGKEEAEELILHLSQKKLTDLARVPLLLLFFCTLWKKGKSKTFPETKTKLYLAIVQYVLDHSTGKSSPARFGKVEDYKEILAEIGKVALECLLKGDHVFEYDQLSAGILCEESLIIGLLQVTEHSENLRPAGMVSFLHKSIQEFLAALYITYRCVPDGSLGEIEQHARTCRECEAFKNVFQFVCGLSEDGAVKVSQHLTSIRISDPTLDLSKADVENGTDVIRIPRDITGEHKTFSALVINFFREVRSTAEFVRHCSDCTGGFVLASKPLYASALKMTNQVNLNASKVKDEVPQVTHFGMFIFDDLEMSDLYQWLMFLDCLHLPLRITEDSGVVSVGDFLERLNGVEGYHVFRSILYFHHGQFYFYITDLDLGDDDHVRLFTETTAISVPCHSATLRPEQLCLKYLSSLLCDNYLSAQTMKDLGAMIRICENLNSIRVFDSDDGICDLLDQIPKPGRCSLHIGALKFVFVCILTSAGAARLAGLLPRFNNIITLYLDMSNCCAAAVDKLVASIATHKTLEKLSLCGIHLTPTAAMTLGQTLPEMLSLRLLCLKGKPGSILKAKDMDTLFGRVNKQLPLEEFCFECFGVPVVGCLAPLIKSLRFFPNLEKLSLLDVDMDQRDLKDLLHSFRLRSPSANLYLSGKPLGQCGKTRVTNVPTLPGVWLHHTPS